MQTIIELPEFLRQSEKILKDSERQSIVNYLAAHPAAGVIMEGTGGIVSYVGLLRVKAKAVERE